MTAYSPNSLDFGHKVRVYQSTSCRDWSAKSHWGPPPVACPICVRSATQVVIIGFQDIYLCQCFTMAAVESMIVPSMSNKKPLNDKYAGGAEKDDPPLISRSVNGFLDGTELETCVSVTRNPHGFLSCFCTDWMGSNLFTPNILIAIYGFEEDGRQRVLILHLRLRS